MRNSRGKNASAAARNAASAWWRGERRSLAIAILLSLVLHVLLLAAWHAPRQGARLQPALVVTLTGAFIAPQRPQVVQPPPAAPAPPPVAPGAQKKVVAKAASKASADAVTPEATPERARATVTPAATPERHPASEEASREPAREPPATDDLTFYRADQLSQGPVPATDPAADRVSAAHLVGRRLVVTVFVDAEGAVRKAIVAPYEITPQQTQVLQEAVAAVRFTPANIDGKPVASQVQSRLCFGDAGLLDTSSPGCWQFNPQPAR